MMKKDKGGFYILVFLCFYNQTLGVERQELDPTIVN
jgi:hypothetical protein